MRSVRHWWHIVLVVVGGVVPWGGVPVAHALSFAEALGATPASTVATPMPETSPGSPLPDRSPAPDKSPGSLPPILPPEGLPTAPPPDAIKPVVPQAHGGAPQGGA